MFGGKKRKQRLQDAGVNANAVLTSVQDTGVTVNNNPRVKLIFQVTAADGRGAFEVSTKATVSRVQIPRPGETYVVRYDPEDTDNFELVGATGGGAEAGGGGPGLEEASAGQIAAAVQQSGAAGVTRGSAAELLASGQRMSAVLMEYSPTGRTVGDQNPAAPDPSDPVYVIKANLQVDGAGPMEAIFMHRVPTAQVSGLRLGRRLEVAVNPANPMREVAIDWAASPA